MTLFPAIVTEQGRLPPHAPLHVPSQELFGAACLSCLTCLLGAACRELAKRIDSGIAANTMRRLMIINASPRLIRAPRALALARGSRTRKAREPTQIQTQTTSRLVGKSTLGYLLLSRSIM